MKIEKIDISKIKTNPNNPRIIKDEKFKKLVKSIQDFPQMLQLRPLVVDDNMVVLGGNMRLKALKELKYKEVYIVRACDLSPEQKKEFVIKDNVGFGDWDWGVLDSEWSADALNDWGLDVGFVDLDFDDKNDAQKEDADEKIKRVECPKCNYTFDI